MKQYKNLNSDMTSGYVHIDITYFFIYQYVLNCTISSYIIMYIISVNVADFLFWVCYFKNIQKNVRIIRKALFGLGLRTRIWRERSRRKITLRPVNTPTRANEPNNGGDEDCAIFFFFFFAFLQMKGWHMPISGVRLWNNYNSEIFIEFIETK